MEEKAPLRLEETCFELYPSSFNASHADTPLSKVFSWFMSPLLLSTVSPVFILGSSEPKWSKEPFLKWQRNVFLVHLFMRHEVRFARILTRLFLLEKSEQWAHSSVHLLSVITLVASLTQTQRHNRQCYWAQRSLSREGNFEGFWH